MAASRLELCRKRIVEIHLDLIASVFKFLMQICFIFLVSLSSYLCTLPNFKLKYFLNHVAICWILHYVCLSLLRLCLFDVFPFLLMIMLLS